MARAFNLPGRGGQRPPKTTAPARPIVWGVEHPVRDAATAPHRMGSTPLVSHAPFGVKRMPPG
ncbi:hypothetical protein SAMN05216330_102106 [Bradyrhizobium sp. Ghvi]|nr:hypothetical protein SAMN05216330_102106 [Bradyrhizobium sp. Ghvi]